MTKTPRFVPGVPGLCRALCRVFHSCAGCAGSTTYARTRKKTPHVTSHTRSHARIYTRHTRHTRHMLDSYRYFHVTPGTTPGTDPAHTCRARLPLFFYFKKEVMEENQTPAQAETITRTIRCSPDNAAAMQRLVKRWPELHAHVQALQAADLFPGLRCLSVTLTGSAEWVAGGVDAIQPKNAPQAE